MFQRLSSIFGSGSVWASSLCRQAGLIQSDLASTQLSDSLLRISFSTRSLFCGLALRIAPPLLALLITPTLLAEGGPIVPAPPQIAAAGYLLIDAETGNRLIEFNADQRLPPASLTKIMTSYVAEEEISRGAVSLTDQVNISVKAWRTECSKMFIREGTTVPLEDLLRGIIIQSGNDASVALAEHIAGAEDAFADVMNQYAKRLGMEKSHFTNATGLPDDEHYTTANDLAILTRQLINNFPEHYKIYSEKYFTYNEIKQPNRNKLLWRDSSVDGVKTGHTDAAGYCLVASAVRDDMRLISVVMGADSEESRATESEKLLSYGFRYFENTTLYTATESLRHVRVWGGRHGSVHLGLDKAITLTIPRGSRDRLKAEIVTNSEIHAPFVTGDKLGELTITLADGEKIVRALVAQNGVQEAGFFSSLWDSISLLLLKLFNGDPLAV